MATDKYGMKIAGNLDNNFLADLKKIVDAARAYSYRAANQMQVISNWLIGWRLVEQEQQGKQRADYGKRIIEEASKALTEEFGKGYSITTLKSYRKFYLEFSGLQIQQLLPEEFKNTIIQIQQTMPAVSSDNQKGQAMSAESDTRKGRASLAQLESKRRAMLALSAERIENLPLYPQLSWIHYEKLIRVPDLAARNWYMREAATQQWDYRTLKRNIDSQYYYRIVQTPEEHKSEVENEMLQQTADYQTKKSVFVKNPLLVEFLGLSANTAFTETTLEEKILTHLQKFMMEMGKGYAFVARQQHIHTADDDYYIDLVFYNYILKCFVLIDLKTTKISYQDVGQMDMYLKMYDTFKKADDDNPTIGIILCSETNADVAQFSTLATNPQMYASKYLTYMPTKEQLRKEIEMQKEIFEIGKDM